MTVIYADIYFLINFAADYLILFTCSKLFGRKINWMRMFVSASFGSVYALISAYLLIDGIIGITANLLVCVFMCIICTGIAGRKTTVRFIIAFYIMSFILGGFLTAFSNVMIAASLYVKKSVPPQFLLFVSAFMCFVFMTLGKKVSSRVWIKKLDSEIEMFGKKGKFTFICDTGNVAVDPYSGKYVIVVSKAGLQRMLGDEFSAIENAFEDTSRSSSVKPRLIPIKTALGDGLLTAFSPEKLYFLSEGRRVEAEACVALDLCSDNNYFGADGVVPFALVADLIQ